MDLCLNSRARLEALMADLSFSETFWLLLAGMDAWFGDVSSLLRKLTWFCCHHPCLPSDVMAHEPVAVDGFELLCLRWLSLPVPILEQGFQWWQSGAASHIKHQRFH